MQLPFASADNTSRNSSIGSLLLPVSEKNKSKTGLSTVENVGDQGQQAAKPFKDRAKFTVLAKVFKTLGRSKRSGSKQAVAVESSTEHLPGAKLESRSVHDEALARVMGSPKDVNPAIEDCFAKPQAIARSQSRTTDQVQRTPEAATIENVEHLTSEHLQRMFVGAPYFNMGKSKDGLRPEVIFVDARAKEYMPSAADYRAFDHQSFEASTMTAGKPGHGVTALPGDSRAALREVPSMLSFHGSEDGTVGFKYYLQICSPGNSKRAKALPQAENKKLLSRDPRRFLLRAMNTDAHVDRLAELSNLRRENLWNDKLLRSTTEHAVAELGHHLFTTLLYPAPWSEGECGTLKTQIESLQTVLNQPDLWYDFSSPEMRLRIGQLLWSMPGIPRRPSYEERALEPTDREILLLQITLAAELLVRLELVKVLYSERDRSNAIFEEGDRIAIEISRSSKVNWDLALAERWLDSIDLSTRIPNKTIRNGLFSRISYLASREGPEPYYQPRNSTQQIEGLVKFAELLEWPTAAALHDELLSRLTLPEEQQLIQAESCEQPVERKLRRKPSGFTADLEYSSANEKAQRFLGITRPSTAKNETRDRVGSHDAADVQTLLLQPRLDTNFIGGEADVGGWLSQSWLSGLVLPGDGASCLLMATLLENSPDAIDVLGVEADFNSGFVYKGRCYWSKKCVIGRILAIVEEAVECMGWVSLPGTPRGHRDKWLQLDIQDTPRRPPIIEPEDVGRRSNPLGTQEHTRILESDFTYPLDGPAVLGNEVSSHGLVIKERQDGKEALIALMTFSSPVNSRLSKLEVELKYDVYFVSAYPCHTGNGTSPACHALHRDYMYDTIPIAVLLSTPAEQRQGLLGSVDGQEVQKKIFVLDCRESEDLQLLGRAWCAQMGESAVISRVGRTCLACSIREACALAVTVVIRI